MSESQACYREQLLLTNIWHFFYVKMIETIISANLQNVVLCAESPSRKITKDRRNRYAYLWLDSFVLVSPTMDTRTVRPPVDEITRRENTLCSKLRSKPQRSIRCSTQENSLPFWGETISEPPLLFWYVKLVQSPQHCSKSSARHL